MEVEQRKNKINMKKPTAVEWLLEQLIVCNYISKKGYENANSWLIQEALEMEIEQRSIKANYGDYCAVCGGEEFWNHAWDNNDENEEEDNFKK